MSMLMATAEELTDQDRRCKPIPQKPEDKHCAPSASLEKLLKPLTYKVVHTRQVTLRTKPSVYADEVGKIAPGDVVKGYPEGQWLRVCECSTCKLPTDGAYTLLDGTPLGVGTLLAAEWCDLTLKAIEGGMKAKWSGLSLAGTVYYLQWKPGYENAVDEYSPTYVYLQDIWGGTLIAEQSKNNQECDATITKIPGGNRMKCRVCALLECGLLVGDWTLSEEVQGPSYVQQTPYIQSQESLSENVFEEHSKKLVALCNTINLGRATKNTKTREMQVVYAYRPKECEDAKQAVLAMLFSADKEKTKGRAEMHRDEIQAGGAGGGGGGGGGGSSSDTGRRQDQGGAGAGAGGGGGEGVGDMFAEATSSYEEGLAQDCNRCVAEVIATLVRKHG